ncbi:MAG: agmatinase [Bdellovibrionales bacterium]
MSDMNFLPLSGREMPRFGGIKTFFRLPHIKKTDELFKDLDVAIFGTPFDGGVSYRPGARFAPSRIREVSSLGRGYHFSRDLTVFDSLNVADVGDCSVVPMSVDKTYELIEAYTGELLKKNKKFISAGGDHSTTLAHLRALYKKTGKPVSLVHFDAHLDTYPSAWGCEYHHGAFVRHAVNEGLIDAKNSIQIGIRGPLAGKADLEFNEEHDLSYITVDDVRSKTIGEVVNSIPSYSTDQPVFISFDIDCIDPSCAPGTGTPVPGGLTTYEVQKLLQGLRIKNLVGADIVEVCPPYDTADITSLAAVDVMFEILCLYKSGMKNGSNK